MTTDIYITKNFIVSYSGIRLIFFKKYVHRLPSFTNDPNRIMQILYVVKNLDNFIIIYQLLINFLL